MPSFLKVDLHTHTSEDPEDKVFYDAHRLIDRAHALGFDALAITNHNVVTDSEDILDYAARRDVLLIPGMEATLSGKHVIILNPPFRRNPSGRTLDDLKHLKTDQSLIMAPHPFFPQVKSLKSRVEDYLPYFDAIEFSHLHNRWLDFNKKAVTLANAHGLPLVGTSDCHMLWEFGSTYSLVEADKNITAILDAVKAGRISFQTRPIGVTGMFRILLKLLRTRINRWLRRYFT